MGDITTTWMTLGNSGAEAAIFEIFEQPIGALAANTQTALKANGQAPQRNRSQG